MARKLPKEKKEEVIKLLKDTSKTIAEIAKIAGVSCETVYQINRAYKVRDTPKTKRYKTVYERMPWMRYDEVKEAEERYKKKRDNRPKIRIDDSSVWMKK